MILEIGLHASYEFVRIAFLDVEVANEPDVRAEIRSLNVEQPAVVTKCPIPMDQVVRMILPQEVLNTIWWAEAGMKVAEEICRADLVF